MTDRLAATCGHRCCKCSDRGFLLFDRWCDCAKGQRMRQEQADMVADAEVPHDGD